MLLATKLKNVIIKENKSNIRLRFSLRNISINGVARGCSGFIINESSDTVVYVNTESTCMNLGYLYRYAKNTSDFHGYKNHFEHDVALFSKKIIEMLKSSPEESSESRI